MASNGLHRLPAVRTPAVAVPEDNRKTVRGLSEETWMRVVKGSEEVGQTHGAWLTQAINAKFEADRKLSRLPAVIEPPVTQLVPTVIPAAPVIETAADHLAVLEAVRGFIDHDQPNAVRNLAARVVVDRLKLLRRQTKTQNCLPEPSPSSDKTGQDG